MMLIEVIKMAETERVAVTQPKNENTNQIKDATQVKTPATLKNANQSGQEKVLTKTTTKTSQEVDEVATNNGNPEIAFYFLENVDNGRLYNTYKRDLASIEDDQNTKKDFPIVVKLFKFPNVQLPDKSITVTYGNNSTNVNESYLPKTLDELTLLGLAYLLRFAEEDNATNYKNLLNGIINGLSFMEAHLTALANLQKDPTTAQDVRKFVDVVDAYLNSWRQFKSEYPDPKSLKKEVVVMATTDATQTGTQTGTQAGSIFSNLLDAVYGILGSIVDALKNYATEIAEVLVAGMLGYSVIRYGRQMINGLVNMVSALF